MDQAIGNLGSLIVLGAEFTNVRGVEPGVGLVRLVPASSFDRLVADLTLSYGGATVVLKDAAVAEVSGRWRLDRDAYRWSALIMDRRWKWRYPRISGSYNVRLCDNTIDPRTKKNARQLAELLADKLGEASMDVSAFPTDAYPAVKWTHSLARLELHALCDLFGLTVCLKLDDTFKVEPLTGPMSLVSGTPIIPDTFAYRPSVMPQKIRVDGERLIGQKWWPLLAVDLDDADKFARAIGGSSWWPGGYSREWPNSYLGVSQASRLMPFQTAHRWFAPAQDITLLEYLAEVGWYDYVVGDPDQRQPLKLAPQLRGTFSILDDFLSVRFENYSGRWRIHPDLNMVETEYPVYRCEDGQIKPALLEVCCAALMNQSDPQYYESSETTVSKSVEDTKRRVLKRPELQPITYQDRFYASSPDHGRTAQDAEAQAYRTATHDNGYAYVEARDVIYNGIVAADLSSCVAQVQWSVGNGRPGTTRVGYNTEFSLHARNEQERRAMRRIHQMAEAMAF